MTKELIERYLQFALDNNFKYNNFKKIFELIIIDKFGNITLRNKRFQYQDNIFRLLFSKEFIEAIVKGKYQGYDMDRIEEFIEEITHQQADAIRDNKLDEFIETLLPKN